MELGKASKNPIQSSDSPARFQIEGETSQLSRCQKCRIIWGCESLLISLIMLIVGGVNLFMFHSYRHGFKRDGLWVLFTLGVLPELIVASFAVRTFIAICPRGSKVEESEKENDCVQTKFAIALKSMSDRYNEVFDVNGKYYMSKMFFTEAYEHAQQLYALINIYLCLIPVVLTSFFCTVLVLELLINVRYTLSIGSQNVRNKLLLLDIVTDMFCIASPLVYVRFVLGLPLELSDLIFILLFPTLSLLSKLHDVWEDYFKIDLQRFAGERHEARGSRKRNSVLGLAHNKAAFRAQLLNFPKWLRYSIIALNVGFCLAFASIVCIQLASQPTTEECNSLFTQEVWSGCHVPVPFCNNPIVGECNCAVLEMTNYSQASLPESFGKLSVLYKLGIYTGELKSLPPSFGKSHKRLVWLGVFGNRLGTLPDDLGELNKLLQLLVFNNDLALLPDSVGDLKSLTHFIANGNRLKALPKTIENLHSVMLFEVSQNYLGALPSGIEKLLLLEALYISNNALRFLPQSIGNLALLKKVDMRHNNLTNLPESINQWKNMEYFYLEGNPLCKELVLPNNLKMSKGLCEPQCSIDCPSYFLGDSICDDNDYNFDYSSRLKPGIKPKLDSGCNTKSCQYDKGDCPR